jgi:hypothetical protein
MDKVQKTLYFLIALKEKCDRKETLGNILREHGMHTMTPIVLEDMGIISINRNYEAGVKKATAKWKISNEPSPIMARRLIEAIAKYMSDRLAKRYNNKKPIAQEDNITCVVPKKVKPLKPTDPNKSTTQQVKRVAKVSIFWGMFKIEL